MNNSWILNAGLATALMVCATGALANDGGFLGVQVAKQKITYEGFSESDNLGGVFVGFHADGISYETAFSQKSILGVTVRVIDAYFSPHVPVTQRVSLVVKAGLRYSSASIGDDLFSGTTLLLGTGLHVQLTPSISGRIAVDYSPQTMGENVKNTSVTGGLAFHF